MNEIVKAVLANNDKNFRGLDLSGLDFSGENLDRASFIGCNLQGCNFSGTSLVSADFSHSCINGASFRKAYIFQGMFRWVAADSSDFREASIVASNFQEAFMRRATFEDAHFSGCYFVAADLMYSNLRDSKDLEHSDFAKANLRFCDLTGSNIDWDKATIGPTITARNTISTGDADINIHTLVGTFESGGEAIRRHELKKLVKKINQHKKL